MQRCTPQVCDRSVQASRPGPHQLAAVEGTLAVTQKLREAEYASYWHASFLAVLPSAGLLLVI